MAILAPPTPAHLIPSGPGIGQALRPALAFDSTPDAPVALRLQSLCTMYGNPYRPPLLPPPAHLVLARPWALAQPAPLQV